MPLEDAQWSDLEWAVTDIAVRTDDYALFRNYYDGNHNAVLSTDEFHNAFQRVFAEFRDNLCSRVVDGKVDRLQITGFGGDKDNEETRVRAQSIWDRNLLNRRQGEIHLEALKMGDAYVMVWPDETGFPIWFPQRAEQIAISWSEGTPGLIDLAAKCWVSRTTEGRYWRVNLYYADRVEKYRTKSKVDEALPTTRQAWEVWQEPGEAWPLVHTLGRVPIFPFTNNGPLGGYGKSELKDVVPIQNALNKANLDLLVAMEFAALPQRWATGITVEIDPVTRKPKKPWAPGADRIISTNNPNAKFGDFAQTNVEQLLKAVEDRRVEMARVSATPLHWLLLGGGIPSGVALRIVEGPLIALIKDRQDSFGMPWEDAMEFSLSLVGGPADVRLAVNWLDPVQVDDKEQLEGANIKKGLGIPDEQIWRELGYNEEQIGEFAAAKMDRVAEMNANFGGFPPSVDPAQSEAIATLTKPARA